MIDKPILGEDTYLDPLFVDDIVGCWLFNEGSGGQVIDLSGNGNTLALTGSWVPDGVKIDASTDRLLADSSVLSQTEGTFICCLNRFASWSQYGSVMNVETSSNDSTHEMNLGKVLGDPQKQIRFYPNYDESSGDYWEFGNYLTIFPLNTDVIVAVVWRNGSILEGYLNGILAGTLTGDKSWTASTFSAGEQASIGSTYGVDYETNCIYKWANAYSRALSASEVALLYREPFWGFRQRDSGIYTRI